ncbi:MAG: hypothetical protein IT306_12315 [Chloroflexi bacterium]|nr:hypothetical protein [Chloroflexota bacterium]
MREMAAEDMRRVAQVKERIADEVMQIPGVVGIGVGWTPAREPCLVILTPPREPATAKRVRRQLRAVDLDNVPFVMRAAGPFQAV